MPPINPFHDAVEWAADELVSIAKNADLSLKDRVALLKDICDRGGLVKGSNVTKKVLSVNYGITEAASQGRQLLEDVQKLEDMRRKIDERIRESAAGPGPIPGEVPMSEGDGGGAA